MYYFILNLTSRYINKTLISFNHFKYPFMKNFIFALLLFSIGCSPSVTLHPLSENKSDFIFKKELMGQWKTSKEAKPIFFIDTVSSDSGPVYHILTPNHTTLGKKVLIINFGFLQS